MPVLLGAGPRLFDDTALEPIQLEKIGVQETGPRTTLRFRVTGSGGTAPRSWALARDEHA
jgi:hypothetical protein